MKTVWKYTLPWPPPSDLVGFRMPKGARPLTIQTQAGRPCVWALVDDERPLEPRWFRIAGTGHPIEDEIAEDGYIGTFQVIGGGLIFHVFEVSP